MRVGKTGCSVSTRKHGHADSVINFNTKKSALCQHIMDFDNQIDWDNVKILKSETRANRRHVAESFLIKQNARLLNVINHNDEANFSAGYGVLIANK